MPGLGEEFTKATGLHASDPSTVPAQVDFALDYARAHGWSPWHGWKGDEWEGIRPRIEVHPEAQQVSNSLSGSQ